MIPEIEKKVLKEFLRTLTRLEKLIIVFYYYEEMTFVEIAKVLEISKSAVSIMHRSIITRCKIYLQQEGQNRCRRS